MKQKVVELHDAHVTAHKRHHGIHDSHVECRDRFKAGLHDGHVQLWEEQKKSLDPRKVQQGLEDGLARNPQSRLAKRLVEEQRALVAGKTDPSDQGSESLWFSGVSGRKA